MFNRPPATTIGLLPTVQGEAVVAPMAEQATILTNWHEAGKARVGTRQENPNAGLVRDFVAIISRTPCTRTKEFRW
jgi:hypothetical protein